MGKKSKRNRAVSTKQKGTRNVEGGISETSVIEHSMPLRDIMESLSKLLNINDYEGILKLESDAVSQAKALEGTEPQTARYIYEVISEALHETDTISPNKEAREKAIHYMERAFALTEKMIDNLNSMQFGAKMLSNYYLREGRHDEAFAIVKRLASGIKQHELIDPDLILFIAHEFFQATQFEIMIVILSMFLGAINRSWDKDERAKAYLAFGDGYTNLAEYEKADSFFQKALTIIDDPESKVDALCQMGSMSRFACNYDDALTALNQALEIISSEEFGERSKSDFTASVHLHIGSVLSDWGKCDGEALESFERAIVIIKEHHPEDDRYFASMYQGIGLVHARLGNWDEAIHFLYLAHSKIGATDTKSRKMGSRFYATLCESIASVRLDQYFWDERLRHNTQKQKSVLIEAGYFSQEALEDPAFFSKSKDAGLTGAQLAYLFARKEEANEFLILYFEAEYENKRGICCRSCNRKAGNGTDIKICRNCQVVDYCSDAHQTLAWRRGRLSHKVMCPFFKRYRLVAKAKNRIDKGEPVEDICKDFFETVCVLKYEVEYVVL